MDPLVERLLLAADAVAKQQDVGNAEHDGGDMGGVHQRHTDDFQFDAQIVWMADIPIDAMLHWRPSESGHGHDPR